MFFQREKAEYKDDNRKCPGNDVLITGTFRRCRAARLHSDPGLIVIWDRVFDNVGEGKGKESPEPVT